MACPEGGTHDYRWDGKRLVCVKCEHISAYQPVPYDEHDKYTKLLQKSNELVAGDISLNDFKTFVSNL